jgi:N-acetylneuraminic acid mutarotase
MCRYIYGGHNPNNSAFISNVLGDVWEFDFATQRVRLLSEDAPLYRTEHAAVVYGDRMFVWGGYSPIHSYRNEGVWYDFEREQVCARLLACMCDDIAQWEVAETHGDIPSGCSAHSAVVYDEKMYTLGGWNGHFTSDNFHELDFQTMTWSRVDCVGSCPPVRSHSAVVHGDSMYVFGGYSDAAQHNPALQRFHFPSKTWSKVQLRSSVCPEPRSRGKMVSTGQRFFLLGGWDRQRYLDSVLYEFNPESCTWRVVNAPFPYNGIGQHAMVLWRNQLWLFGGFCAHLRRADNSFFVFFYKRT